jgi:hypothetical protein
LDRSTIGRQSPLIGNINQPLLILALLTALATALILSGGLASARGELCVFLLTTTLVAASAWDLVKARGDGGCWDLQVLDTLTLSLTMIVGIQLLLGTIGFLQLPAVMVVLAGMGIGIGCVVRPSVSDREPSGQWSIGDLQCPHALLTGLVMLGIAQLIADRGVASTGR